MKVRELIDRLQKHDPDAEVCVGVTKCVSPAMAEPVSEVGRGFDWTSGKVMLRTKDKLMRMLDTCTRCGMYGVEAAKGISSRFMYTDMDKGDMEVAVYLGKKKMFSVPFNVKAEMARAMEERHDD